MPSARPHRQLDKSVLPWLRKESSQQLLHEAQRQAIPELTRVFGHSGLYLRSVDAAPAELSGNMLASLISLYRNEQGFAGDFHCLDEAVPLASASLALVYAAFVLETSAAPRELLAEIARVLKPEGQLMLLSLNPWGPARLRWGWRRLRSQSPMALADGVREVGLEIIRERYLGPVWSADTSFDVSRLPIQDLLARTRVAHLLVARRRDPGMTPLRKPVAAFALRPGVRTG